MSKPKPNVLVQVENIAIVQSVDVQVGCLHLTVSCGVCHSSLTFKTLTAPQLWTCGMHGAEHVATLRDPSLSAYLSLFPDSAEIESPYSRRIRSWFSLWLDLPMSEFDMDITLETLEVD